MNSNILLTGSTGFIGRHFPAGFSRLDLRNNYACEALIDLDCIIHLAALAHGKFPESECERVNVSLALELVKKAKQADVKRFIYLSSMNVVWNENPDYLTKSRIKAESELTKLCHDLSMDLVIVRVPLVYGVNTPGNLRILLNLVRKFSFSPFGLLKNKRSFISAFNLVDFLLLCSKHPNAPGNIFSISDSEPLSWKEFLSLSVKNFDMKVFHLPVPAWFFYVIARLFNRKLTEMILSEMIVDMSQAKSILDWKPPYSMQESLTLIPKGKL
ncbi:NAD-dependent epimerase/dehydratase family protein [Vibrio fluvialis]|uniref:NAD-dependent epimerase/dehydratase family protein n=1 Tax=Vibrio fluvialis TaxID=676 RepID=UPI0013024BC6|nr:NAD-dependent epimerase/dehydratase family protein [Vibrio fluvialis]EKO3514587.1 NAD-dependent epimerase/dehydratase family protein [Vibrio fluvialis]MCE7608035.1 NAD-dependent epimerase/dehydratase family protein [Vibrio fluvialis]UPO64902.1 NAD dependent epimerase/dehydratase [Vibrio fluvialis]